MPTVTDSWYGTAQSNKKCTNKNLLFFNDKLLDRLNSIENYLGLPQSTWYAGAGKPSAHGIPHYMITSDQGDEYIRDRVDYVRNYAGVPAFPWAYTPSSTGYWGKSMQCGYGIPPITEMAQAIGRLASQAAGTNLYLATIKWTGTTYFSTPLVTSQYLGGLPESDPRRRIQYFQVGTSIYNWRRAPRLIDFGASQLPASSEYQWYNYKNEVQPIVGSPITYTGTAVDVDDEDSDTYLNRSTGYGHGEHSKTPNILVSPPVTNYQFQSLAKHWDYGEELRFDWEDNPFAEKTILVPIWPSGISADVEEALTPLEVAFQGSGAWTTDTGDVPSGGSTSIQTVESRRYRDFDGQVRVAGSAYNVGFPSGYETFYDSGSLAGMSAEIPLPTITFVEVGSDDIPTTYAELAAGTPGSGAYRWFWPDDTVNVEGSGPLVTGAGLSSDYANWKNEVNTAGAIMYSDDGKDFVSKTLTAGWQEQYLEKLRIEYQEDEGGAAWLYWLRPEVLQIAQRPA